MLLLVNKEGCRFYQLPLSKVEQSKNVRIVGATEIQNIILDSEVWKTDPPK